MTARNITIYFYLKYGGEWEAIYDAISSREPFDEELFEILTKPLDLNQFITIVDDDYPENYKMLRRPPFVVEKSVRLN